MPTHNTCCKYRTRNRHVVFRFFLIELGAGSGLACFPFLTLRELGYRRITSAAFTPPNPNELVRMCSTGRVPLPLVT